MSSDKNKQETGSAWIKGLRKPFINPRLIKRGQYKGRYEVYLTAGRDKDENIKCGRRCLIHEKDIVVWPDEEGKST